MKKILCIAVMALVAQLTFAQTVDFPATEYTQDPKANYRLYKTKNTYNFIKLDTRTGQMEMVQWTTSGYPGTYTLSDIKRVDNIEDEIPGRLHYMQLPISIILSCLIKWMVEHGKFNGVQIQMR